MKKTKFFILFIVLIVFFTTKNVYATNSNWEDAYRYFVNAPQPYYPKYFRDFYTEEDFFVHLYDIDGDSIPELFIYNDGKPEPSVREIPSIVNIYTYKNGEVYRIYNYNSPMGTSWLYEISGDLYLGFGSDRVNNHNYFVKDGDNVSLKSNYWSDFYTDSIKNREQTFYKVLGDVEFGKEDYSNSKQISFSDYKKNTRWHDPDSKLKLISVSNLDKAIDEYYIKNMKPITIKYNGVNIENKIKIINKNNITYYPFREILELVNANVEWDSKKKIASGYLNDNYIKFNIGNSEYISNNFKRTLPNNQKIFINDGKTYVPIRVTLESLGLKVGWDNKSRQVIIEEN